MALPEPSHEKELKHIRIIQKHETEANWNKATKFIPKLGEVIIYDPDANHTTSRIKIGDGTTVVANLPFVQQGFIDSELSNTSENAVQNKVIKVEIDKKQDNLGLKSEVNTDDITISPLITVDSNKRVTLLGFNSIQGEMIVGANGVFENSIETPMISHSYPDGSGYTQINIDDVGSITFSAVNNDNEDTVTLSGISEPTFDTDAANKSYVDTEVAKNKITVDTTLSSTSTNPVQNKVVNAALAGKAKASHTHNLNDVTIKTAFNTTGSVDYISRSLVPYVSGTKFYGMPAAAITVEYSRDGGATWVDYGLDNGAKMRIFDHSGGANLYLGKASTKADNNIKNMLRITVDATKSDGRYLSTDSMFTWMSSNGNTTCVTLEVASYSAPTTFRTIVDNAPINGWSGPNMSHYSMITFGGSTAGSTSPNNQFYRLTYKQTAINSNYPSAIISDIRFFGSTVWGMGSGTTISNNMLKQSVPYSIKINSDSKSGTVNFTLLGAAFGNCTSDGKFSLAGGIGTTAGHEGSITYGEALNTSARCQAIFGRYNKTNASALLQVGNGSSAGVKTAFSVFNDGHAEVQTQGTTDNSVVIKSELPTIITF